MRSEPILSKASPAAEHAWWWAVCLFCLLVEPTRATASVLDCTTFTGADLGAKIAACINALPAAPGGGIADARGFDGAETWGADPFGGTTKNVTLLLGAATITVNANVTVPFNARVRFEQGAQLAVSTGVTITWLGGLEAQPQQKIFSLTGSGVVLFNTGTAQMNPVAQVYPGWWGAKGDGVTDDTPAIQSAVASGASVVMFSPSPTSYLVTSQITVPNGVWIAGPMPGNSGGSPYPNTQAVITFNGAGDLFVFNGANGSNKGFGGGVTNLTLRHTGTQGGRAIVLTGTDTATRAAWTVIRNLGIVRDAGDGNWQWGIYLDGSPIVTDGIRDIYIEDVRMAQDATLTAAPCNTGAGCGAIRLVQCFNVYLANVQVDLASAKIEITGSAGHLSSQIDIVNSTGQILALDYAQGLRLAGGGWNTISFTTNATGNLLHPSAVTNTLGPAFWAPSANYTVGQLAQPNPINGHIYKVTAITMTGTSGTTQPDFQTSVGAMITDNQVTWTENGLILGGANNVLGHYDATSNEYRVLSTIGSNFQQYKITSNSFTIGTHEGQNGILNVERFSSSFQYATIQAGSASQGVKADLALGTRDGSGGMVTTAYLTASGISINNGTNLPTQALDVTGNVQANEIIIKATAFLNLPSAANGTLIYCNDCQKNTPCQGSGVGALAKRLNGGWDCN